MNQTSVIAASLIIAYIVFVTVRGELPAYLGVFTGQVPAGAAAGGQPAGQPAVSEPAGAGDIGNSIFRGAGGFGGIDTSVGGGGLEWNWPDYSRIDPGWGMDDWWAQHDPTLRGI